MTVGIHTVNVANATLDWLRGTAPAAISGLYVKLHIGDPGAAGTTSPSAVTTRRQATMNAASGGQITLNTMSGNWAITASETISHISVWNDPTAGNPLFTAALTVSRSVVNGDTVVLTSLTVSQTPLMA